jgi:hypothetical protein
MPDQEVKQSQKIDLGGRPEKYTKEVIDDLADEFLEWLKKPNNVWFKDFCLDKNIDPRLMTDWAKKSHKFSEAYILAQARQESKLMNGGLFNKMNAGIVKFALVNNHGYNDKKEVNVTSNGNPLPDWAKQAEGQSKDLVNELIKE